MIGIIIAGHKEMAVALKAAAEMIYGELDQVEAVSFEHGEGLEEVKAKLQAAEDKLESDDGLLVLLDLFGGTPMNASAMTYGAREDVRLLVGVNLPMIFEAVEKRSTGSLDEIQDTILENAKRAIGKFPR
ncbi:PTS sugar transporter subunit IIA [Gottschalkiaceae bacterium SANA]|nr:PTS sugar transporter subunit IIA [Gottschalkiaceae bacterium SANA]